MTTDLFFRLPDYFTSLIDAMQDGFVLRAPDGTILEANAAFCALVGAPRDEVVGQRPPHPWWPAEARATFDAIQRKYLSGAAGEDQLVYQRSDGARVPVLVTNSPLRDGHGRLLGFIGATKDITERVRAERRLTVQYELTRVLAAETLPDAAVEVLRVLCDGLDWDVGVFWTLDDATQRLLCLADWNRPDDDLARFNEATEALTFARGDWLPGAVWERAAPIWIADIADDMRLQRRRAAGAAKLGAALGFPVRVGERIVAVIELLRRDPQPPDDGLLTIATAIGGHVGQFVERVRAEQSTRESEDRFRSMANGAPVLLWVAGPDMGATWFNDGWLAFTGRTMEQELGDGWTGDIHPDDHASCVATYSAAYQRREPFSLEYRLRHADGTFRWIIDNGTPRFNPDGGFVGYIGSATDISERKRAEDGQRFLAEAGALLAASLDYRTTLNSVARLVVPRLADWCAVHIVEEPGAYTQLAVAHVDPAKIEWAREVQEKYPSDPNSPTGVPNVLRTGRPELIPEITDEMLVAGTVDEEHLRLARSLRFSSAMVVPMNAREQTIGAITLVAAESGRHFGPDDLALAEDLARRAAMAVDNARLYEQAQEAARVRDRFLAVAAHELRSPLTATKGFAQLLLRRAARTPSGEEWIAPLRTIDNQVNKVATLVNRLLDISRIQEQRLQLQPEPGDLLEIVRESVAEQQLASEGRRILFQTNSAAIPGAWDRARLGQVLTNLLDNAVKYSPEGGAIHVGVTLQADEAVISVRDEGPGIPRQGRERLFERYYRSDAAAGSGLEGMGLGLYVAKGIVEAHGGRIWLDDSVASGATFHVALPLRAQPGDAA